MHSIFPKLESCKVMLALIQADVPPAATESYKLQTSVCGQYPFATITVFPLR
jgi:hypothetical protein